MSKIRIKELLVIDGCVLGVYYCPGLAEQFSVIDETGQAYSCSEIFSSAEAAEGKGSSRVMSKE